MSASKPPHRSQTGSLARGTPVCDALEGAITAIAAAGCDTPRLDAELLLADALGVSRERVFMASGRGEDELTVAGPAVRVFQDYVRRRAVEREPVAACQPGRRCSTWVLAAARWRLQSRTSVPTWA